MKPREMKCPKLKKLEGSGKKAACRYTLISRLFYRPGVALGVTRGKDLKGVAGD